MIIHVNNLHNVHYIYKHKKQKVVPVYCIPILHKTWQVKTFEINKILKTPFVFIFTDDFRESYDL